MEKKAIKLVSQGVLTEKEWKRLRRKMIRNTVLILIPGIIFGVLLY